MLGGLLWFAGFFFAGIAAYLAWPRVKRALDRFEEQNLARMREEWLDRRDGNAHFKHTLRKVAERTEPVTVRDRLDPVSGRMERAAVFLGTAYGSRREAEEARLQHILAEARRFYQDIDRLQIGR